MSADNWAVCPRCKSRDAAQLATREVEVSALYGVVSVAEFDQARERLTLDKRAVEERRPTFREDYEFYGAETGTVTAVYSGECTECGLRLSFEDKHDLPV